MFIDTHTHIYTEEFDADRAEVVGRAIAAGAEALLLPAIDEGSLQPLLDTCAAYPDLCFPMLGLHPTELPPDPTPVLDRMERLLDVPGAPWIAIGEVGIDLYWDDTRRDEQIAVLERQARWAADRGLPLVIHSRNAHRPLVETLRPLANRLTGGIFHCFGGTAEEADELLRTFPTFMLGIGGVVTFKKSTLPQVLADVVPLDRLVIETDAPYLAPTPHRGHRNEPAFIPLVLQRLAEVYGCSAADIAAVTTANARRIFKKLPLPFAS